MLQEQEEDPEVDQKHQKVRKRFCYPYMIVRVIQSMRSLK